MATILPENSTEIRCICGFDHDDNFTIQCERCNAWQHARCVNISDESAVPDNFLCPECSGTEESIDVSAAREYQRLFLQRLANHQRGARNKQEEEEEPRRRGRKRHGDIDHNDEYKRIANLKYYNVPSSTITWSEDARRTWLALDSVLHRIPPKDLKTFSHSNTHAALEPTRIENKDRNWQFGPSSSTLTATSSIPKGKIVCEIFGEVKTKKEYCDNPINQFDRLGCPQKGVAFLPNLPLVIDCRRRGSEAIFLRRSSHPNCKIIAGRDDDDKIRILLYSRKAIPAGAEVTLGWYWPQDHPIRQTENSLNTRLVNNILWLLGVTKEECHPVLHEDSDSEDWSLCSDSISKVTTLSPLIFPTKDLVKQTNIEIQSDSGISEDKNSKLHADVISALDTDKAPEIYVWCSPVSATPQLPSKKRVSLADYMRKHN